MGTTRKNAYGISSRLVIIKNQNRGLIWNSASAEVIENILQFLWQDNNIVLAMTTAYSLNQTIWRERKRPALISTNTYIIRPVFGDAVKKWLEILLTINEYNHGMNKVDRANQLRRNYTIHRPQIYRTWLPQWYWLMDTSATNGYLMTLRNQEEEDVAHQGHRKYQETMTMELLTTLRDGP